MSSVSTIASLSAASKQQALTMDKSTESVDGISRMADADQALLRRMELLEQRILSPPIRNYKPTGSLLPVEERAERGLDQIVYIHQNSGSQHSFSFENSSSVPYAPRAQARSPPQSQSLQQANQLVDDHLRVIGQKLLISTTFSTDDAEAQESLFRLVQDNTKGTLESNNRPLSPNSLPSSVSATIMSYPSIASNQTLVTAHVDRRNSDPLPKNNRTPSTKPFLPNGLPSSSRPVAPGSDPVGDVGNLANKRKSFIPTKRVLTSIIDSSIQPEGKKKRLAADGGDKSAGESRSVSPNVGGPDESVVDHPPTNNKKESIHDVHSPVPLSDNGPLTTTVEHVHTSRGSLSNPPFPTSASHTTTKKPPVKANTSNNAVITAFFPKASDKNTAKGSLDKVSSTNQVVANTEVISSSNKIAPMSNTSTVSRENDTTLVHSLQNENSSLKAEISSLQAVLQDKMDQLNAVANNQTIVHAHLRAQVSQCEKTLASLQDELKLRNTQTTDVIEILIRKQCTREVVELRQQLASDGARLGRLVFSRVGMHSVESWEDGFISKNLKRRKDELRRKRDALLKQQSEQAMEEENSVLLEVSEKDILYESILMQIKEIQRQEVILEKEEESVYLEKASHIKALKRLACEDASRFSSRPKLHDRYIPMSLLGKGGFSEVWMAYDLTDLREVAVKIHQLDPRWSEAKIENYTKHVAREYEIHRDVRHPRIVSLYDVFEIDNNSFATVLEYCKGTDLDTLLKERKYLPERRARLILLQILSGMKYLSTPSPDKSRQGIIHYDLKPGNILFDENGDAKITDFGLSKILDSQDPADSMELTSQGAGTYWYLPPECFVMDECVKISNKVDVWSIGIILYQMLFGKRPFGDGQSQDKVLSNSLILKAREVRFPATPCVSEESKQFIQLCLTYDQQNRPTIAELCKHSYVLQTQCIDSSN